MYARLGILLWSPVDCYFIISVKVALPVFNTVQRGHSITKIRLKAAGDIYILKLGIKRSCSITNEKLVGFIMLLIYGKNDIYSKYSPFSFFINGGTTIDENIGEFKYNEILIGNLMKGFSSKCLKKTILLEL